MENTTTNQAPADWRLLRVYDVRPIDFVTGKRAPVSEADEDLLPNCSRCDKKHAKVYVVTDGRRDFNVGGGCVKLVCAGWEPRAEEVKRVQKVERDRLRAERKAAVDQHAGVVKLACSRAWDAADKPEPQLLETRTTTDCRPGEFREIWGDALSGVKVWTLPGCKFDYERRAAYSSSLKRKVTSYALAAALVDVPLSLRDDVKREVNLVGWG